MTFTSFFLVALGALLHSYWNIVAKQVKAGANFSFFSSILIAIFWSPIAIWLGWKVIPLWGYKEWLIVAASGLIKWFYFVVLMRGYKFGDLSVVYPIARGSGPLFTALIAIIFFKENLDSLKVAGIMLIVLGILWISGGLRSIALMKTPAKAKSNIFWGVSTGILISTYTLVDAYAVKIVLLSPILLDYWGNILRLPFSTLTILVDTRKAKIEWKAQRRSAITVALLSPISYILVLYAMQISPVSSVAPAREMSMLFAVLIGGKLIGETLTKEKIIGAFLVGVGVLLVVSSRH